MNLIEEMFVAEKLRTWESYVEDYLIAKNFDEAQPSSRRRIAQLLIGLGLTLDPEAAERVSVPAKAITAGSPD